MEALRVSCVVMLDDGASRRVGSSGLLIGRKHDCDVVSDDPSVSRRHALIRLTSDGAEVVPLSRGWIEVNRKRRDQCTALADGDRIAVPGLELTFRIEAQRPDHEATAPWRLARSRGGNFGIVHSPFVIGGGDTDDLIIQRWPRSALRFYLAQGELYLEVCVAKVRRNTAEQEVGTTEPLVPGDELEFRRETFVVQQSAADATTVVAGVFDLPSRVVIEMLPRGGRVVFTTTTGERPVFLADRRLDLLMALLRPPAGHTAGEFITDEVVAGVVWPRNRGVTRTDINVLISRCRRDLVEAGLAGARLIERAPGGGATRLALAPGAAVIIES